MIFIKREIQQDGETARCTATSEIPKDPLLQAQFAAREVRDAQQREAERADPCADRRSAEGKLADHDPDHSIVLSLYDVMSSTLLDVICSILVILVLLVSII